MRKSRRPYLHSQIDGTSRRSLAGASAEGAVILEVAMKSTKAAAYAAAFLGLSASAALAGDPESCKSVRFSDVGWTDITATTSVAGEILKGLGYTPKVTVLSVPVTYTSMKNKDIDVFLGNWQPSMENDRKPYI